MKGNSKYLFSVNFFLYWKERNGDFKNFDGLGKVLVPAHQPRLGFYGDVHFDDDDELWMEDTSDGL